MNTIDSIPEANTNKEIHNKTKSQKSIVGHNIEAH